MLVIKVKLVIVLLLAADIVQCSDGVVIQVDSSSPYRENSSECWENGDDHPCATLELGLQGLQWQLKQSRDHQYTLLIAVTDEPYFLSRNDLTQFTSVSNLEISSYYSPESNTTADVATIKCAEGIGFSFTNSNNINLSNIVFDSCGQLRNSTSYNLNRRYPGYVQFIVTLYFLYCQHVTFDAVTVQNTLGMGTAIYNTNGNVSIADSNFVNNQFQSDSGGGGVYIEFSYCDPLNVSCLIDGHSNVDVSYTQNATYSIVNTNFLSNRANISQVNATNGTYILPYGKYHNAFGRGGGASIYMIGNATNVRITFENCSFINNSALWGAGLLTEFHDNAHRNYLVVKETVFSGNFLYYNSHLNAGTGGGGVRIAMFMFPNNGSFVYDNNVIFVNCNFTDNDAYYGGGFSYYTTLQSQLYETNHVELYSCAFTDNTARLGAAIDLSVFHPSIDGIPPSILLHDLLISNNHALYHSTDGAPVGIGALYIDTLSVKFEGTTTFNGNRGSALVLSSCHIEVMDNATLLFTENLARSGGGIVLYAGAFIVTHPNSHMRFINNSAEYYGGAIYNYYSGVRDQFGSGNCFLRFSDIFTAPDKWTSSFYFEANSAEGFCNSIYTSTVLPCVWGSAHGSTNRSEDVIRMVFCWGSNWQYRNLSNDSEPCHKQIATAPARYTIPKSYSLVPGQIVPLNAVVWDDMSNVVTDRTVFVLRIVNGSASFPGNSTFDYDYSYVSHDRLSLQGQPDSQIIVQVETNSPIIIETQIEVNLLPCPPGFYAASQYSTPGNWGVRNLVCLCDSNYKGHVHCNQTNYTSSILRTGWIGHVPSLVDAMVYGTSPYLFDESNTAYIELPQDPKDLQEFFCSSSNSRGVLCGSCKEGYGVPADFLESPCVSCPPGCEKYSWAYYLLTEFLPVMLFFVIVFVFSMTVTFGPLNSYIFFAQVISTVMKINGDGEIIPDTALAKALESAYLIPYSVWNMNFFRTVLPRYCLSSSWDVLSILNIGYLQALFPIFLLLLFVVIMNLYGRGVRVVVCLFRPLHRCLARFRQWTNLRQSATGGMAAFVVIAYTKFVLLALYILTPSYLIYPNGTVATTVFYLDGDVEFNAANAKYMIPSVIVLIFAAIPPILLAYPTLLGVVRYLSCKRIPVGRLYPSLKLQAFLDEFHGCYRDGSDGGLDCRWFASLYFCLRVALISIYTVTDSYFSQFTIQCVFFIFVAVLFLVFQPYRKPWLNQLDVAMFLLMTAISSLCMYNVAKVQTNQPLNVFVIALLYILVLLPLFYCIGYYLTLFCMQNKSKWFRHLRNARSVTRLSDNDHLTPERGSIQSSGLEDSAHVPNFIDFVESTGRMRPNVRRLQDPQNWYRAADSSGQRREERTPLMPSLPQASERDSRRRSTSYQTPSSSYGSTDGEKDS